MMMYICIVTCTCALIGTAMFYFFCMQSNSNDNINNRIPQLNDDLLIQEMQKEQPTIDISSIEIPPAIFFHKFSRNTYNKPQKAIDISPFKQEELEEIEKLAPQCIEYITDPYKYNPIFDKKTAKSNKKKFKNKDYDSEYMMRRFSEVTM